MLFLGLLYPLAFVLFSQIEGERETDRQTEIDRDRQTNIHKEETEGGGGGGDSDLSVTIFRTATLGYMLIPLPISHRLEITVPVGCALNTNN